MKDATLPDAGILDIVRVVMVALMVVLKMVPDAKLIVNVPPEILGEVDVSEYAVNVVFAVTVILLVVSVAVPGLNVNCVDATLILDIVPVVVSSNTTYLVALVVVSLVTDTEDEPEYPEKPDLPEYPDTPDPE